MKKEGAKRVEITAVDDERQITAVFAGGGGGGGAHLQGYNTLVPSRCSISTRLGCDIKS